ncbi:hypothetical protein [Lachnoclostridium sp.]|uniref:hypothetical protein n=1 Tax=Lachnoclostridium sp. TaxID=2028282 RepID=UPI00289E2C53|nr:hypothetical protein [Lachnoclostridium sp.]
MYNIKLDVNDYFTGTYAKVGRVDGGIDLPTLPPTEDNIKALAYKYCTYERQITKQNPVVNEDGDVVLEEYEETVAITDWVYDEAKYQQMLDEINSIIPPVPIEQEVVELRERCAMLDQTLAVLLEETLPAIVEMKID